MIKCITILARRRREKIISFTLDKDRTFTWALEPPAGLEGVHVPRGGFSYLGGFSYSGGAFSYLGAFLVIWGLF